MTPQTKDTFDARWHQAIRKATNDPMRVQTTPLDRLKSAETAVIDAVARFAIAAGDIEGGQPDPYEVCAYASDMLDDCGRRQLDETELNAEIYWLKRQFDEERSPSMAAE